MGSLRQIQRRRFDLRFWGSLRSLLAMKALPPYRIRTRVSALRGPAQVDRYQGVTYWLPPNPPSDSLQVGFGQHIFLKVRSK
jgi:hypothetical protein